jgi:hypothetical protein
MSKDPSTIYINVNRPWFYAVAWGGGAFIIVLSLLIWWNKVYLSNDNVFWGMIESSLSTTGVTKTVTQSDAQQQITQESQLVLGSQNFAATRITYGQKLQTGETKAVSESIGTATADYVRYSTITSSGKQVQGAENVVGLWGKTTYGAKNNVLSGRLLSGALLNTIPIGNLNSSQRTSLVNMMKSKKAYEVDNSKTKHQSKDGQRVYVYTVKLNPQAYAAVLQQFAKDMHFANTDSLNPDNYASSAPTTITLSVNPVTRQLTSVTYEDGTSESFSSYGALKTLNEPTRTISTADLQQRLQTLQQ